MFEQAILNYEKAIDLNPFDYHTKYLLVKHIRKNMSI